MEAVPFRSNREDTLKSWSTIADHLNHTDYYYDVWPSAELWISFILMKNVVFEKKIKKKQVKHIKLKKIFLEKNS